MHKIKGVIFDLDGTIADTVPLCIKAFRQPVESLVNRSISDSEIVTTFGLSEEGTIMALAPNHYEKGISDYLHFYETLHEMCPTPFKGIEDLLDTLKNKQVRIAMVTGKGKYSTDISLRKFGPSHFFEIIETGSPKGHRKADGIKMILDLWDENISKNEIIYVADALRFIIPFLYRLTSCFWQSRLSEYSL